MGSLGREAAEAEIGRVLQAHWHRGPEGTVDSPPVNAFAHDVYNLLVRGASDVQVERHLRGIERDDLHQPEFGSEDLQPVLRALRSIERSM